MKAMNGCVLGFMYQTHQLGLYPQSRWHMDTQAQESMDSIGLRAPLLKLALSRCGMIAAISGRAMAQFVSMSIRDVRSPIGDCGGNPLRSRRRTAAFRSWNPQEQFDKQERSFRNSCAVRFVIHRRMAAFKQKYLQWHSNSI
ncbi:hypothetical protein OKW34_002797 [Paraburkholderia youngii]